MRLYEITANSIPPNKFVPQEVPSAINVFDTGEHEMIGKGSFAKAFSDPQEPGTVRKIIGPITRNWFLSDSYYKYVEMLAQNDRFLSNPYFPKIYDVQVKSFDRNGREMYAYAVDMERLHDYKKGDAALSDEEAEIIGNMMFYDFDKQIRKGTQKTFGLATALMVLITDVFRETSRNKHNVMTKIKDPEFKKALLLLKNLRLKQEVRGSMAFDIHEGNIMIRRGRGIPHLVLTDPVV